MKSDSWSTSRSSFGGAFLGLLRWQNGFHWAPKGLPDPLVQLHAGCAMYGDRMDKISEDFCLGIFPGCPPDTMEEKEHSKDHSLPAGRYAWRFTQPCIYISYTSPLSIITPHHPNKHLRKELVVTAFVTSHIVVMSTPNQWLEKG